jgi:transposase
MKLYCGLDIHKNFNVGCIMDEKGNIIKEGRFENSKDGMDGFFSGFAVKQIVFESTGFWWPVYEMLEAKGYNVVLAHPYRVKAIASAKLKTDKVDSRMLAHLLRANLIPESYIPTKRIRDLRNLVRHRSNLVKVRVTIKNKIKAYLLREGIKPKGSYLFTERGKKSILSGPFEEVKSFIPILNSLDCQIKESERKINNIARNKTETSLLLTIPGIGKYSALLLFAEIADIHRFKHVKNLLSYAGLAPMLRESAGKGSAKLSHESNHLIKGILTEIVGISIKYPGKIQRHYYNIKKKKGWRVARISTARYMLTIVYAILTKMQPYIP